MATGRILSSPCPAFPLHPPRHSWPLQNPARPFSLNPYPPFHPPSCFRQKPRRWDPNAETVRTQRSGFEYRDGGGGGGEGEEDGGWSSSGKERAGLLKEVIDNVRILKALSAYGWLLPGIILSMLLSGGLKAFLLSVAALLGASAFSFALEKLWASMNRGPRHKGRTRSRRPRSAAARSNGRMNGGSVWRGRKVEHRSWVAGGNGSVGEDGGDAPSLGGWDELDGVAGRLDGGAAGPQRTDVPGRPSMENSKLRRRRKGDEAPLLLRLLAAVFPFLGSWAKLL